MRYDSVFMYIVGGRVSSRDFAWAKEPLRPSRCSGRSLRHSRARKIGSMTLSVLARKDGGNADKISYRQFGTPDFGVPSHDSNEISMARTLRRESRTDWQADLFSKRLAFRKDLVGLACAAGCVQRLTVCP